MYQSTVEDEYRSALADGMRHGERYVSGTESLLLDESGRLKIIQYVLSILDGELGGLRDRKIGLCDFLERSESRDGGNEAGCDLCTVV
jgi:hypothetical protein